ncbi:MAG TPA: hypothetical protein VHZ55_06725 [Bryobacteraceae bacterium]|jgi:hypothetical protein|nr:hypothetical protein [Bryobacteraceae bacterium]
MAPDSGTLFEAAQNRLSTLRIAEAIKLFNAAEESGHPPDECAAGRWKCHMLGGQFSLAWQESDQIARRANPDPHRYWDGQPLSGKRLLIRCLHGLGDTMQFVRYARPLRAIAQHVTIEAQPKLKELLTYSELADRVITWGEAEPRWDKQIEITELPRIFNTGLASIPNEVPYLRAPLVNLWPRSKLPRVGIVWNASNYDPARSIPAKLIQDLFDTAGVECFSLQAGPERFDLDQTGIAVQHLYEEGQTMLETASLLLGLDLVITVDTMTAHFAGALGQKVWTLLPFVCDWRWMLARNDTPWYPGMHLFRQERPNDWGPLLTKVRENLTRLAGRSINEPARAR